MPGEQAVLLDTNAYSALYVTPEETARKQGHPVEEWRSALRGQRILIAFQTRAELIIGARSAKWGDQRMKALNERIASTPTVQLDGEVFDSYVTLTVVARPGHRSAAARGRSLDRCVRDREVRAASVYGRHLHRRPCVEIIQRNWRLSGRNGSAGTAEVAISVRSGQLVTAR